MDARVITPETSHTLRFYVVGFSRDTVAA